MNNSPAADGRVPRVATWIKLASLTTLEVTVSSGADTIILDMEHSPLSLDWVHTACAVAQPRHVKVWVRLPGPDSAAAAQILDIGVDGIVVPQITSANQVRDIMNRTMFPPLGQRGGSLATRAGRWGLFSVEAYLASEARTVRCIQVETAAVFEELDEVLHVRGVNCVLFGGFDLALSLGVKPGDPEIAARAAKLIGHARRGNVSCGAAVATLEQSKVALAAGFDFVVAGNDATTFADAQRTRLAALKGLRAGGAW